MTTSALTESLIDIYELAKAHDPQLKANNAVLNAAFADAAALRSGVLPRLSARVEQIREDGEQTSLSPLSAVFGGEANQSTQFDTEGRTDSYAITLEQSILSLPAIYDARRASNIRDRAIALLAEEQQNTILRVSDAYFAVLRSQEGLRAARKTETAIANQSDLVRNRFEAGLVQATDLLETQVNHDTSQASRIDQEEQHYASHQNLRVLTGGNSDHLWPLRDDFAITPPQPERTEPWEKSALEHNYRLRAAQLTLNAAQNALRAKRSAHLPSISASLTQHKNDSSSTSYGIESINDIDNRSVRLRLEVPLFLGGRLHAERKRAYQEYLQARAEFSQTRRDVVRQVRALHNRLKSHVTRVAALARAAQSAERALLSIRNSYETGTREILDVLNAERSLYQTQRNHNHARMNYLLDTLRLKAQTGGLREKDLRAVNSYLVSNISEPASGILPHRNITPKQ